MAIWKLIDPKLREKGIFLVPVGELEYFCDVNLPAKKKAYDFINKVIDTFTSKDFQTSAKLENARNFVTDVLQVLKVSN